MRKLRITLELPENIVDLQDLESMSYLRDSVRETVGRRVSDFLTEEYVDQIDVSNINKHEIAEKVKEKIISRLADKAIKNF